MNPTDEQQRVIDAPLLGPHLVDAGAGTGKTFTLVERAAALVASGALQPQNLLVVTFTRAAAAEIAGRLEHRFARRDGTGRPTCGTFHQIAAGLLREFAYDTGTSPDVRAIDDARARGVFATAFRDLTDGKLGVDTSVLPLLDRTRELERNLAGIALRLKNTAVTVDQFEREALAAADALARLPFGAVVDLKKDGKPKKDWPKPNPPLTPALLAEEADRERRNVRAVAALFRRFDELLAAEHLLTFGDVLTRATAMLRNFPEITASLRARWVHAMVDEFQDTNPIQVAFLKALFGEELCPVLVVGDVRQAIYAFNGADPEGIVTFRTMPQCLRYPLSVNRRSFKPILDVAHTALAGANAVPPELHNELTAHRGDPEQLAVRAQLFTGEGALEREADAVANTAYELVRQGASPKSIAVLMRSRSKAPLFAAALRSRGLAVQLHGGAGFFGADEIRDVVAWLQLVETPGDAPSLVVALQSAAINLGDGALAVLAQRDLAHAALVGPVGAFTEDERERIERFQSIARVIATLADVPLADAVRTVVLESGAEVARLGGPAGALDQARANLDKFVRLAADFAADRPTARIRDFLVELEERAELDDDEAEAELEGERIALMTVHAAKGLEWDHVFVANVSPASFPLRNGGRRDLVAKLDEERRALAFMHAVNGRTPLRWLLATMNVDETNGQKLEKPVDDREEHRLFYVALTRARNALYVTGRLTGNAVNASACLEAVRGWLADRGHKLDEARVIADNAGLSCQLPLSQRSVDGPGPRQLLRRLEAQFAREAMPVAQPEWHGPLSYTAIALHEACPRRSRYHYVFGLPDLSDDAPANGPEEGREPSRRDPARFGRIVHYVLERVALAHIAWEDPMIDHYLDDAMDDEGCPGDLQIRAQAHGAVKSALPALRGLTPVGAEERFDVEIDGVALNGYIDLVARDANGRLVIVDYKTGSTPAEHYAMQFALYLRAVGEHYTEGADTVLLRIGLESAALEPVAPASTSALSQAIAAARRMERDDPRPGIQCRTCPYALVACDAAPA